MCIRDRAREASAAPATPISNTKMSSALPATLTTFMISEMTSEIRLLPMER